MNKWAIGALTGTAGAAVGGSVGFGLGFFRSEAGKMWSEAQVLTKAGKELMEVMPALIATTAAAKSKTEASAGQGSEKVVEKVVERVVTVEKVDVPDISVIAMGLQLPATFAAFEAAASAKTPPTAAQISTLVDGGKALARFVANSDVGGIVGLLNMLPAELRDKYLDEKTQMGLEVLQRLGTPAASMLGRAVYLALNEVKPEVIAEALQHAVAISKAKNGQTATAREALLMQRKADDAANSARDLAAEAVTTIESVLDGSLSADDADLKAKEIVESYEKGRAKAVAAMRKEHEELKAEDDALDNISEGKYPAKKKSKKGGRHA